MTWFSKFIRKIYTKDEGYHLVNAMTKFYNSVQKQFDTLVEATDDSLSVKSVENTVYINVIRALYSENDIMSTHYIFDGELSFDGAKQFNDAPTNIVRLKLPIGVWSVSFITNKLANPTVLWQIGIDFVCSNGYLYIDKKIADFGIFDYEIGTDTVEEPKLYAAVWLHGCKKHTGAMDSVYGNPLRAELFSNNKLLDVFMSSVRFGLTNNNLYKLVCILTNTDPVSIPGTVISITAENNRHVVLTDMEFLSAPMDIDVLVDVGDIITPGQFIFNNAKIYTNSDIIPETDFPSIHLSEGMLGADVPGGVFLLNKDIDKPTYIRSISDEDFSDNGTYLLDPTGDFDVVNRSPNNKDNTNIIRIFSQLSIAGLSTSVDKFHKLLNDNATISGVFLLDTLKKGSTVNLFREYQQNAFGPNAIFLRINTNAVVDNTAITSVLSYINNTLQSGTIILTFLESGSIVEYPVDTITDFLDVFMVPDIMLDTVNTPEDNAELSPIT